MSAIRQILGNREMYFLTPDTSVFDAAKYMAEKNVGAVCVLEDDRLVGILSERDIMTRVVAFGREPKSTRVGDVMTFNPVVVDAAQSYENCIRMMKTANFRHLPVVEEGKLLGLLSLRDLLQVDISEKDDEIRMMRAYIHFVPPGKA